MTVEEKILKLRVAAMEEARAEGNTIMKRHEDALRKLAEQHKEEARRQSETRIKAESTGARQQLNMAMSKAQLEMKREIGKKHKELKKKLFHEVELRLQEFMKTEEYKHLLVKYIEKAAQFAGGEEMTIYINPTDESLKTYLEEHTGMELTISKEDFVGGVRAVIHKRNILIDHAYKGALESEYHKFLFKGGAAIG